MADKTIYHKANSEDELIKIIQTAAKKNWDYLLISGVSDRHYWGELSEPTVLHQIDFNPSITQGIRSEGTRLNSSH